MENWINHYILPLLVVACVSSPAHAEAFDWECFGLGDNATRYELRLSIDTADGHFCVNECQRVLDLVPANGEIFRYSGQLGDDQNSIEAFLFDLDHEVFLHTITSSSNEQSNRLTIAYNCAKKEFTGLSARAPIVFDTIPSLGSVSFNYPSRALRLEQEGDVVFRAVFDEAGRATKCAVLLSSANSDLDRATCATVMRFVTIDVGLDANGTVLRNDYISIVRWSLD